MSSMTDGTRKRVREVESRHRKTSRWKEFEMSESTTPTAARTPIDAADTTIEMIADLADQLRAESVRMAERAGSGHPTSSMSAADLVAVLIARHLRIDPGRPDELGNDRLIFSKGHASPLLYSALDAIGALGDVDVVDGYRRSGSILEGHPTPRVPGVQVATGSLGLGPAIGIGMTIAHRRLADIDAHVWVLCGDSELAEGSVWEAVEHAGAGGIAGMTVLVDVNRLGQTGETRHGWDVGAYERRFSAFGWNTLVVDGHDVDAIDGALDLARRAGAPTAVIARTRKGAGVPETDDTEGKHGKPLDDPDAAIAELGADRHLRVRPHAPTQLHDGPDRAGDGFDLPTWEVGDEVATRDAFGQAITAIGRARPDVVALDAEVGNSTRLDDFADEFPDRFFQMYIAEQLAVGAAIGLDASGWTPCFATFGAFLTRAHDILRMATVARSDLLIAGSHAGVSIGEDGPSQMALEDLAMMRALADSTVVSPSDANQTAALLAQMVDRPGICYVRTMRGDTPVLYPADSEFRIGGSVLVHDPPDAAVTLVATGVGVHEALEAAQRLSERGVATEVLDVYSIKPIDTDAIVGAARRTGRLVVIEDHRVEGGLGDAVAHELAVAGASATMRHLAVRSVPTAGSPAEQRAAAGIDAASIVDVVTDWIERGE
jgi:transketolase